MSKIKLMGDSSGQIEIDVPAAAGVNIVRLPAATGDVVVATKVEAATDNAVTNKIAIEINGTVYYLLASTSAA